MSGKKRPAIKVTAKRKGQGSKREDVCAIWVNDDGSLYVKLGDGLALSGAVVTTGKEGAWFVAGYVNEEVTLRPKSGPGERAPMRDAAPERDRFAKKLAEDRDEWTDGADPSDDLPF